MPSALPPPAAFTSQVSWENVAQLERKRAEVQLLRSQVETLTRELVARQAERETQVAAWEAGGRPASQTERIDELAKAGAAWEEYLWEWTARSAGTSRSLRLYAAVERFRKFGEHIELPAAVVSMMVGTIGFALGAGIILFTSLGPVIAFTSGFFGLCMFFAISMVFHFWPDGQTLASELDSLRAAQSEERQATSQGHQAQEEIQQMLAQAWTLEKLYLGAVEAQENVSACQDELDSISARLPEAEAALRQMEVAWSNKSRLLRSNWRLLVGIEFEQFLKQVFEELGYDVETTQASGDQGVDLIAVKGALRLAIQAKGYPNASVGNKAVQEAFSGMHYYRCSSCAVVTNSTFTSGARELADSVTCRLVDGDGIEALIMGQLF